MALTTETDIANYALSRLGIKKITDIDTDTTKEARACETYIDDAISYVARESDWYSLFKRDYIYKSATAADDDYEYKYDLPSDFEKVIRLYPKDGENEVPYRLRGSTLVTNLEDSILDVEILSANVNVPNDTLGATAHTLYDDEAIIFTVEDGSTVPAGLTDGAKYWVVNRTDDTFELSLTKGGTPIDLTTTGSGTFNVNRTRVDLDYTRNTLDPTEMTPELRVCVAYRLAFLIAFLMTGSTGLQDQMRQNYTIELLRAKQMNVENRTEDEEEPLLWGDV